MTLRAIIWAAVSTRAQTDEEKYSLPDQEKEALAVCQREGWRVIDVMRVPGHSRAYLDIREMADDMLGKGIDAGHRLLKHFEAGDYDVLVVRDGDRFARSQSIHARVVETVILHNRARIFTLKRGWVDEQNFRMFISMDSYKSATDIDQIRERRRKGVEAQTRRGIPTSTAVVMSHKRVRDERGKAMKLVLDESKRRLWDDLATVFLEGIGYEKLAKVLYTRFGHADTDGTEYPNYRFQGVLWTPAFWGHTAMGRTAGAKRKIGMWRLEPGHPIPEGVTIEYNTHEPVYKGELAERVKAEMLRRMELKGRQRPWRTYMFTSLVLCGACGYYMLHYTEPNRPQARKLYCVSRWQTSRTRQSCDRKIRISERRIQEWLDEKLRALLLTEDPGDLLRPDVGLEPLQQRQGELAKEVADLESQITTMILEQSKAAAAVQDLYRTAIQNASDRLATLRDDLADTERRLMDENRATVQQEHAWQEIVDMSLERFWQQEPRTINQMLHRLMGKRRLVVLDGEIVAIAERPPDPHRRYSRNGPSIIAPV